MRQPAFEHKPAMDPFSNSRSLATRTGQSVTVFVVIDQMGQQLEQVLVNSATVGELQHIATGIHVCL